MASFSWPSLDASRKLSSEEATELATRIAELTKAGLPLGDGLRALADELPGRWVRHVLNVLANRLDAGDDLAVAINSIGPHLPAHLRGLILAGLRSGRLAEVLEEYVDLQNSQAELRRRVFVSVLYPFVLIVFLTVLTICSRVYIVVHFQRIFLDFGTTLPMMTQWFIASSWSAMYGMIVLCCAIAAVPILLATAPRVRWLWPVLNGIPMIGPLLRWSHVAQFSRLMSILLEQQVPLPDALRLTSDGLIDSDLAWGCRRVADEVETGQILYERMAARSQFPASLIPLIEWGQRAPALPDSFLAAAEMFEGRLRSQGSVLEAILLPSMFLLITGYVAMFIISMLLPLLDLIKKLS
jgi:type II secretory pathway component PulF